MVGLMYMSTTFPAAFASSLVPTIFRKQGLPLDQFWVFSIPIIPYWLRWAIGPIVDTYWIDGIGRRKTWMLPCTIGVVITYGALAFFPPSTATLWIIVVIIFVKSAFTATQEVAIDAYMVDNVSEDNRTAAPGVIITAEAFGQIAALTGLAFLLERYGWTYATISSALLMVLLLAPSFLRREPAVNPALRAVRVRRGGLTGAFKPLQRYLGRLDSWVIAPIYIVSGFFTGAMVTILGPFLIDMKFEVSSIGVIIGVLLPSVVVIGSVTGFLTLKKFGVDRVLVAIAILSIPATLPAMWMAHTHTKLSIPCTIAVLGAPALIVAVYFVVFGAARIGFASKLQAGTDYVTSSAITRIGQTISGGLGGPIAAAFGWSGFFLFVGGLGVAAAALFLFTHVSIEKLVEQRNARELRAE